LHNISRYQWHNVTILELNKTIFNTDGTNQVIADVVECSMKTLTVVSSEDVAVTRVHPRRSRPVVIDLQSQTVVVRDRMSRDTSTAASTSDDQIFDQHCHSLTL